MAQNEKKSVSVPENNIPRHIAIIMDGNGRWATARGLPRTAGHAAGAETFRRIARYAKSLGVNYLTVYAFSTENWKRPEGEVKAIMRLLENYLDEAIEKLRVEGLKLRVLGDVGGLSPKIRELIAKTDKLSETIDEPYVINLCINYGGRAEITNAVRKCAEILKNGGEITEETVSQCLYTASMPDPELVIRTGGEVRLSNFLLWQSAYAELYFSDVLWPDFDEKELNKAIDAYRARNRRFGGV